MKKYYFLFFIFCFSLSNGQSWQWAIKDSGTGNDVGTAICVDSAGNNYTTGSFQYNTYFNSCGSLPNFNSRYLFVSKSNARGTCQVVEKAGANPTSGAGGNSIAVDKHGNVLVTGQFYDSVSFGSIHLVGSTNLFVAQYYNNGNIKWAKG